MRVFERIRAKSRMIDHRTAALLALLAGFRR
jgi:hypothetical protein